MGRSLVILVVILSVLFLASCEVSFQEAMKNIQNPNIEVKTSVKVPVVATDVDIGNMVMDYLEGLEEKIEGLRIEEGNPVVLRYSTTLVDISPQASDIPGFSSEIPIDLNVNMPNIGGEPISVSLNTPELSPVSVRINIPVLPKGERTTDSTQTEIDMSVDSSILESFVVNGSIDISFELPPDWTDVEVTSIHATLKDGNGRDLVSGDFPVSGSKVSVDISGKEIGVGSGKLILEYYLTVVSDSDHGSGDIELEIKPNVSIKSFKGLRVNVEGTIDKPSNIEEVSFKSGQVILRSDEVKIQRVVGNVSGRSLETNENGEVVFDVSGLDLPLNFTISEIDGEFTGSEVPEVQIKPELNEVVVDRLTIVDENLEISESTKVDIGEISSVLQRIKFGSGKIKIVYDSSLPVNINVSVRSPNFSPELSENIVIESNTASEIWIDLSGRELNVSDRISISIDASPEGYDGERLTLEDIKIGESFSVQATLVLEDLEIEEVTFSATTMEASDTLRFDTSENASILELLSYFDMEGTLTSNVDISGYMDVTLNSSTVRVTMRKGEVPMDDVLDLLKEILMSGATIIDYDVKVHIEGATVRLDEPVKVVLNVEVPLVADFGEEGREIEIYNGDVDLGLENPESIVVHSATLTISGTNTSGFEPILLLRINDRENEIVLSKDISAHLELSSSEISALSQGSVHIELYAVLKGKQSISSDGIVKLRVSLVADLSVVTGGE